MDINLEKIDIIRERTGVSYREAKDALERANGNLVDAIIELEERSDKKWTENIAVAGNDVIEKLKEVIKKGNVTRVILKKDGEILLNIPVTAGAVGVLLAPMVSIIGVSAALATKMTIEIVKNTGETVDLNEMAEEKVNEFKSKVMGGYHNMGKKEADFSNHMDETLDDLDDGSDY